MTFGKDTNGTLFYLVIDHLGSTSLTLEQDGDVYSEMRYKPFSETAWSGQTDTPTRRQYTGQINDVGTGLYFYNAGYYDPALGRFTQADTIVPEPGNFTAKPKAVAPRASLRAFIRKL
jgi:RHS repeat-associated protein